jgi:hypothetical protein
MLSKSLVSADTSVTAGRNCVSHEVLRASMSTFVSALIFDTSILSPSGIVGSVSAPRVGREKVEENTFERSSATGLTSSPFTIEPAPVFCP